jgi:acetolactate synthase-1/2/3 large subunit
MTGDSLMRDVTVADLLIQRIAMDGVYRVFSVTGGGIMYLVDSIARSQDVSLIPTHHEEFAGVAADGYARAGKPYGVAIGTAGPGAAHLFTAIAAAWQDSSPVLFIAGQVKTSDSSSIQNLPLRQNGTFEFDTTKTFKSISKHSVVLISAQTAANEIEMALRIMREGRPGPVVIEIPLDVQGALVQPRYQKPTVTVYAPAAPADTGVARASLSPALARAERPLVLLGIGVIRAGVEKQIVKALDKAGLPYITTQFARGAGRRSDPLFLGSPGIKSNRSANLAIMNCDLLIAIGTSLHQQVIGWDAGQFQRSPSHKIWFEIDRDTIAARGGLVNEAIQMSAQDAGLALIAELRHFNGPHKLWLEWRNITGYWRSKFLLHYPAHADVMGRMCLYRMISALDHRAETFSAVVTDAGLVWYAVAQHYFIADGSHYISSGSFGSMGMALPMAIGAAAATRQPVIAITGDGSAMMCLSELATLRAQNLPVLFVINNNNGYVSIRSTHDRYFEGRKIGTDVSNGVFIPKFQSVAATFGLPYRAAHSEEELDQILDELLAQGLNAPALLEVFTYTDQAVEPLLTSIRGPDGQFKSPSLADMHPPIEIRNV